MGNGNEAYQFALDERMRKKKKFFHIYGLANIRAAAVHKTGPKTIRSEEAGAVLYATSKFDLALLTGVHMEQTLEQMQMINEEIVESKKVLQSVYNEFTSVTSQLNPLFRQQIATIRDARMATVSEIQIALVAMRDIRKFFLETDYEKEMKRLSEFVELCKEMKRLKEEGIFDALCDTALKLAVPGERRPK